MISCYFGVPGCGKTTLLTKLATRERKRLRKRYNYIYTINFSCEGCIPLTWDDLGRYRFENSLILIDEITLLADNRDFKSFPKDILEFFTLHRHMGLDIVYATQNFENVDKKIRDLTHDLWYMSKSIIPFLSGFTFARRIYRNININEYTSELTLGYRFCSLLESFFARNTMIIWRRKYYRYMDSFDLMTLKDRELFVNNVPYTNLNRRNLWTFLKRLR